MRTKQKRDLSVFTIIIMIPITLLSVLFVSELVSQELSVNQFEREVGYIIK